tara:strand:- start:1082 stop:3304 length:2223 start_codon:yes stop_codon:yes gene_type:complete
MRLINQLLKQVLFVAVFCVFIVEAQATHLVGGELTYTYVGTTNNGQMQFEVHCYIYRDCSSSNTNGTGFDTEAAIGVYQGSTLISTVSAPLDFSLVENIVPQNPNNCAFLPDDLCIERAEYIATVTVSPSLQPYTLVHQRCCRSPAITNLNLPQDQGFSLTTMIPGNLTNIGPNSTPVFNELPQAFVCSNYPFLLDNSASDSDGDSLSYSLCPIFLGGSYLSPTPNPPTGPPFNQVGWATGFNAGNPLGPGAGFSINPSTGILSGSPDLIGKFALGVCVLEWRDGQQIGSILRDFTLDVVTCNILAPGYDSPDPCTGLTAEFDQLSNPCESYTWDFGVAGTTDDTSTEAEPSFTYEETGIYDVSLYFETGTCSDSLFFEVVAMTPWDTDFSIDNVTCSDGGWIGDVNLDFSDWGGDIEWNWSFGGNSIPSVSSNSHPESVWFPSQDGIQVVLESSAFGCVNDASETLNLPELPLADFDILYEPCSGLDAEFQNLSPESGPFSWNFGGGGQLPSSEISPTFTYPSYGTYEVVLTAGAGSECPDTHAMEITLLPIDPFGDGLFIQPVSFCDSTGFVLLQYSGSGADEIFWNFPGILESEGNSVIGQFPGVGMYQGSLTLFNEACDITQTVDLDVSVPEPLEGIDYVVPNVFSPNNDSNNDSFRVEFESPTGGGLSNLDPGQFTIFDMKVYNRWGNLMFASGQAGSGWRATDASAGTYYVVFKSQHVCDEQLFEYAGEVTLVR